MADPTSTSEPARIIGPRADYCCEKCMENGLQTRAFEAPVNGKKMCPTCGRSRYLQRQWTPPHVSTGLAKASDAMLEPGYVAQQQQRDHARELNKQAPSMAVPIRQLAPTLAAMGRRVDLNSGSRPSPAISHPTIAAMSGQHIPPVIQGDDRKRVRALPARPGQEPRSPDEVKVVVQDQ